MLPTMHRASWVLISVIGFQCISMLIYLSLFSRKTLVAMWQRLGLTFKVSFVALWHHSVGLPP